MEFQLSCWLVTIVLAVSCYTRALGSGAELKAPPRWCSRWTHSSLAQQPSALLLRSVLEATAWIGEENNWLAFLVSPAVFKRGREDQGSEKDNLRTPRTAFIWPGSKRHKLLLQCPDTRWLEREQVEAAARYVGALSHTQTRVTWKCPSLIEEK